MIKSSSVVIRVITIIVMTLFFSSFGLANDKSNNAHQLFFTLENERQFPDERPISEFDCSDKVYAVMHLKNITPGKHHLAVLWHSPDEELRELTEFPIHVTAPEIKHWAWLKLHRALGASMLQLFNPAAGMEEFIGDWRVDVKINDTLVISNTFKVIC